MDMSFENLSRFDDSWKSVLYAAATRAKERGIELPVCHLSFYMPNPKDAELMAAFSEEQKRGIDAAALMKIPLAVIHPIAFYSKEASYGDWVRANMAYLSPLVKYAGERGVKLCVENMASEREAPDNHLYGSCALNISALAGKFDCGICFDVGHANISGFKISEQMEILKGKIDVLHVHDNNGIKDRHLLPFEATVDWEDVALGMQKSDFCSVIDVEVSAWSLSGDLDVRRELGGKVKSRAQRLLAMADLI
jgi:sugar phosphate isomerase/epimerase